MCVCVCATLAANYLYAQQASAWPAAEQLPTGGVFPTLFAGDPAFDLRARAPAHALSTYRGRLTHVQLRVRGLGLPPDVEAAAAAHVTAAAATAAKAAAAEAAAAAAAEAAAEVTAEVTAAAAAATAPVGSEGPAAAASSPPPPPPTGSSSSSSSSRSRSSSSSSRSSSSSDSPPPRRTSPDAAAVAAAAAALVAGLDKDAAKRLPVRRTPLPAATAAAAAATSQQQQQQLAGAVPPADAAALAALSERLQRRARLRGHLVSLPPALEVLLPYIDTRYPPDGTHLAWARNLAARMLLCSPPSAAPFRQDKSLVGG